MRFEAPEHWDPADPDPFRSKGNAVHAVVARMRTADDLGAALQEAIGRGDLSLDEADALARDLDPLFRRNDLAPWFSAQGEVRSEATLITADGHAARPDRLAMEKDMVRVLDMKTGLPSTRHHDQVKVYMDVLRDAGHPHVSGYLLYIATGDLVPVEA